MSPLERLPVSTLQIIGANLPLETCSKFASISRRLHEVSSTPLRAHRAIKIMRDFEEYFLGNFQYARSGELPDMEYYAVFSTKCFRTKIADVTYEPKYKEFRPRMANRQDPNLRALVKNGVQFLRSIDMTLSGGYIRLKKTKIEKMFAEEKIDLGARMARFVILDRIDYSIDRSMGLENFGVPKKYIELVKNKFEAENTWYKKNCAKELMNEMRLGKIKVKKNVPEEDNGPSMIY